MSIPSQLYFAGMVSPTSKLVVLKVKAADVAVLLDDILEATELLLEDETARLDDELEDKTAALLEEELATLLDDTLATLLAALLEELGIIEELDIIEELEIIEELDSCAAELELLPGDEPPQAANNKNEKHRPI